MGVGTERTTVALGSTSQAGTAGSTRLWAAITGIASLANIFLVPFCVTTRPRHVGSGPPGWFGRANNRLVAVQYAALLCLMYEPGRRML